MVILSSGLCGKAIEKFFIFNGDGRNGKEYIDELTKVTLGDYFYSMDSLVLQENKKFSKAKESNPELAGIHKKRLVVCKEPSKSAPLQNSSIRDLTGGGTKARMNYSNKTEILLWLKLIMECNSRPPLSEEAEKADTERIVDIHFKSLFSSDDNLWDDSKFIYPVNPNLKNPEYHKRMRNYFLNILLTHFKMLKEANFVIDKFIPENVKQRSTEYLQNSFDIQKNFVQYFEKKSEGGNKPDMTLQKIVSFVRNTTEFNDLPKQKKK